MSELSELEIHKNSFLLSIKDDVDPLFNQTTMVTETPSTVIVQSPELTPSSTDDGSTVQKFSVDLKKNVEINKNKMSEKFDEMKIKRKRRRRKSKRKSSVSLSKTQWKFQVPKIQEKRKQLVMAVGQPIVPYNTNKFLMEDHMPEVTAGKLTPTGRTRESSFSVDSEENYFYSLPEDEEEFLTKEFSSVYEDARSERLDNMSKPQLIQEYLQLESSFDQLSRKFNVKTRNEDISAEFLNKIRLMEEQIKKLNTENIELRQQMEYTHRSSSQNQDDQMGIRSSEDSESDSSSSSSSSNSHNAVIRQSLINSDDDDDDDCAMVGAEMEPLLCNGINSPINLPIQKNNDYLSPPISPTNFELSSNGF